MTRDSDMIVIIVVLASPWVYILNQAKVSYTSSMNIFNGKVIAVVRPDTTTDHMKNLLIMGV